MAMKTYTKEEGEYLKENSDFVFIHQTTNGCPCCGKPVDKGTKAYWVRLGNTDYPMLNGIYHKACFDKATNTRVQAINNFLGPINDALKAVGHGGKLSGSTIHIPNMKNVTLRVTCEFKTIKPVWPNSIPQEVLDKPKAVITDMTFEHHTKDKRMTRTDSIVAHVTTVRNKHLQEN